MAKLHQILAIESGEKKKVNRQITDLDKAVQAASGALFEGHVKTYQPRDEEGVRHPTQAKKVQLKADEALKAYETLMSEVWDITATKEWGNYNAPGVDIVIDGEVLVQDVPIPYLLFLSKQLDDVETIIQRIPTLDPSVEWTKNHEQDFYQSPPVETTYSQKVRKNHVLAEATEKHPAQVQIFTDDVVVGHWTTVRHSGALSVPVKQGLLENVRKVKKAVLFAREQANEFEVQKKEVAKSIFDFIMQL